MDIGRRRFSLVRGSSRPVLRGLLVLSLMLVACAPDGASPTDTALPPSVDTMWPGKEWPTSTPEEQGMDSARLQQMMAYIDDTDFPLHSVILIRHGHIVLEEYRNGYHAERSQEIQSVTKSFSSTLIGIALRLGLIEDVNVAMVDLFPDHTIANLDARKQRITLEHLLIMSEGLDWHEHDVPYDDPENTLGQMWVSKDAVQHVLDRPMAREPGESWAYNWGTSILLGGIIEEVTGADVASFAEEHLFEPIGVEGFWWAKTTGKHYLTDAGLWILPRDMARLGYLMLHQGTWDGQEIVSAEWVAEATRERVATTGGDGYGYQWWTLPSSQVYRATGHHGQVICVVPEADMVVVFTGDIPDGQPYPHDALILRYILDACSDLPDEVPQKRYARYGWACDYPAGFRAREWPIEGAPEPSDTAGMMWFQFVSYPQDMFLVVWGQANPNTDLASRVDKAFVDVDQESGVTLTRGAYEEGHKGEHRLIRQAYEIAVQGQVQHSGTAEAWYCPESGRAYVVVYGSEPGMPSEGLASSAFQRFLDSMVCHARAEG